MQSSILKFLQPITCIIIMSLFVSCDDNKNLPSGFASPFNGEYLNESNTNILNLTVDGIDEKDASLQYYCYGNFATLTVFNAIGKEKIQIKDLKVKAESNEPRTEEFVTDYSVDGKLYEFKGRIHYQSENIKVFDLVITSE